MNEPTLLHTLQALEHEHQTGFWFLEVDGKLRTELSYARCMHLSKQHAQILFDAGVRAGDRVALVLPDPQQFILTFCAAVWLGAIPVPLAPPYVFDKPENYSRHLLNVLEAAGAGFCVLQDKWLPLLQAALDQATSASRPKCLAYSQIELSLPAEFTCPIAEPDPRDTVFLQFTSGSTSVPKGVKVTHASLAANAHAIMAECLHAGPHDVGVNWLPLFHDMGLIGFVLAPLRHRMPVVHMSTAAFIARPARWLDAIHRFKGTISFAPNFAYALVRRRIKDPGSYDLSSMRIFGCGAEPIQAENLIEFAAHFGASGLNPSSVTPCYGMAEATLAISFSPRGRGLLVDWIDPKSYRELRQAMPADMNQEGALGIVSCGRVLPGHEVRILDEQGNALPDRAVGEIVFSGPSVADGYWSSTVTPEQQFNGKTGLHTGDLGYRADGEIYISGRKKDLIIINGRNVAPQDVEVCVETVPGIKPGNVIAFSVNDATGERAIVAAASQHTGPEQIEAIRKAVMRAMALTIDEVLLLPAREIPKTSSGKLQRQKMKSNYEMGLFNQA